MSDSKQEWEGVVAKWGRSLQARAFNKSESNGLEEALKSKKDTSPTSQASERRDTQKYTSKRRAAGDMVF